MRDILPIVDEWLKKHKQIALATVVRTWGSSPRREGAKMALTPDGNITGSVSGGCVEAAVFETGVEVIKTRRPQLLHFGVADETAWEVGLACGGQIDVFVQPLDPATHERARGELLTNRAHAIATVIRGPENLLGRELLVQGGETGSKLDEDLEQVLFEKARQALADGRSQTSFFEWKDEVVEIFIEVVKPAPALVIVGGVHIAIALTSIAKTLGYATVVVDPRRSFGTSERFPDADRLIRAWPDEAFSEIDLNEETAIAMLTHDPKIDDPALIIALKSQAFYIGALGSQKTQAKRRERLLAAGLTQEQLDRLHGPIGLAIGGETPEEIALAIMAEVVAIKHGSGRVNPVSSVEITAARRFIAGLRGQRRMNPASKSPR
jgi:xanthine dehydrogenase accessory factor